MFGTKIKREKKERRQKRLRARIRGSASKPRLSVFRSSRYISAQLIDDENGKTLLAASDYGKQKSQKKTKSGVKKDHAYAVGEDIAKRALSLGISKVVFDRGPRRYHGRVKSLAEGARKGGLIF